MPVTPTWTTWSTATFGWSWTLAQAHDTPPKARGANAVPTHTEIWEITSGLERGCQQQANPHSHFCCCCCCVWCRQPQCCELLCTHQGPVTATAPSWAWPPVQCHLSSRNAGPAQTSLPSTHSGRHHSSIFITILNTTWLWASHSSSHLTIPELMVSVSQQGKTCPAGQ